MQHFWQVRQADRLAVEAVRQFLAPFHGAVGNRDAFRVLRGKVCGAQFDHFAGADEQYVLFGDLVEDALRQAHGGGRHGHAVGADFRAAAHFLGDRKAALEQLVQIRAQAARFVGRADGILDLPQDLRFAQHHRIEPGGDAEGVAHGIVLRQHI